MNEFLDDPTLQPIWSAVQARLDRNGLDWRGRLTLPALLPEGRRRLGVILERHVPPERRSVALAELAAGVERISGVCLVDTLDGLGHRPAGRRELTRARDEATQARRAALDAAVAAIPAPAPWARPWAESAWTAGLFAGNPPVEVDAVVRQVVDVLGWSDSGRSRTEIAARILGNAHALDSDTRLAALVTRALRTIDGPDTERAVWERAGIPLDLVSMPVLTWGLPLTGNGALADATRVMTRARLPLHISIIAVRQELLAVHPGTPILVVENPRLVEAAAQIGLAAAVICTHGNPTTAPTEAIRALLNSGAILRYHGDFDGPGLAMAARAAQAGCAPFLMSADDYSGAVDAATIDGVILPADTGRVPETAWDPELAEVFAQRRLVVHEERVMDEVLAAHLADS